MTVVSTATSPDQLLDRRSLDRMLSRERDRSLAGAESSAGNFPYLERRDISFHNSAPDRVSISVTLRNPSVRCTEPTSLTLQAAPFGAFVPWRDLTTLDVRSLQPGETITLETEAFTPKTQVLGDFSQVPPAKLVTALAGDDDAERRPTSNPIMDLVRGWRNRTASKNDLPTDPLAMLCRPGVHWAGNLNVLMNGVAVERHMAQALRIYPGRTNLAMFFVGSDSVHSDYSFELGGTATGWDCMLYDMVGRASLLELNADQQIEQAKPVRLNGSSVIVLGMEPPKSCLEGTLDVNVTQLSTGQKAVVEFSLDATAAGPGCFTL